MPFKFVRWFTLLVATSAFGYDASDRQLNPSSLSQRLANIQTVSGQFSQQLFDPQGVEIDSYGGSFALAKTAKLLWQIESPTAQQIVSNGSLLWIYDPDLEQVVIETVGDKIELTPMALFNQNSDQIEAQYRVVESSTDTDTIEYHLTAKDQSALFKIMAIRFVDDAPVSISLIDRFDQTTDVEFTDLDVNLPLEDSIFEFSIPDGIDVIRNDR